MATGSSVALRREDWPEIFFECHGHEQAFDDHGCAGWSRDRVQGHSRFVGLGDELRMLQRFRKAASIARTRSRGTPGGMARTLPYPPLLRRWKKLTNPKLT
jgi:hypothetical protein